MVVLQSSEPNMLLPENVKVNPWTEEGYMNFLVVASLVLSGLKSAPQQLSVADDELPFLELEP